MGFSKVAATLPTVVETPIQAATLETKPLAPRTAQGTEDKKVKGQVAMHAIISGYDAASRLVLTLAPKPDEARNLLHTLAAEIAAKIETYSFHE